MSVAGLPPLYFETFLLMFVRIATAYFLAPVLGNRSTPRLAKIAFAAVTTFILLPIHAPIHSSGGAATPATSLSFALLLAQEFLVGAVIGYSVQVLFAAIQMGGQLIGIQVGLNIATAIDPISAEQQISYIDQFYAILTALVFLAIDGHHGLILALSRSFEVLPLNTFVFNEALEARLLALTAEMFAIALRIALPVLAALLLADVGMMIIGRMLPQMNVFLVGLPLKLGLGLFTMLLGLPLMLNLVQSQLLRLPAQILALILPG
ncbi:MAG: flagellar biosynthetic protein FliR [Chloroflexi bacterium]|nr:flagellar biosynthetic protein FliR [Chloroflexota bacterium]